MILWNLKENLLNLLNLLPNALHSLNGNNQIPKEKSIEINSLKYIKKYSIQHHNLFKHKQQSKDTMNKWAELLLGLILLIGLIIFSWASATYGWVIFGKDLNILHAGWIFFKGGIFWLVAMLSILLILLGLNDLKSD